jgi:hypothetical protein
MQDTFKSISTLQCPQCGDSLPLYFKHIKLVQCSSCKSTIFLENEATRLAGDSSVLAPEISIISLNTPFSYEKKRYLPLGKIRYSYGRGFWEEWWLKDSKGKEYWLSIDEGDLVLEQAVKLSYAYNIFDTLKIADVLKDGIVTEIGTAKCEGFDGALPKIIEIGASYEYAHLSGKNASLVTLEKGLDEIKAYEGKWISPFDIKDLG